MAKTCEEVWDSCLNIVKDNIPPQSFKTWFEPIKPVKLENSILTILVPSQFFYEWLEEHYVSLLKKTIKRELGPEGRLEYRIVVENSSTNNNPYTINVPTYQNEKSKNPSVAIPLNISTSIKNPFVIPGLKQVNIDPQLNPNYSFDSFVEGECNQLGKSAGFAVATKPGTNSFNPLVIYGGTGLGKTHLVQAIGNQIKQLHNNKTVLYVQSEKFTNQFIEAVKNNSTNDFVAFYQMIDVLIIDDIQFFENKERTQDILFHIFNHLHQSGKQLILTSDRPPRDLNGIEERLLSRFKWGLTTDIQQPDFETRIAILEKKMYNDGIELSKEIVEFIAYNITNNVRELEGALISLLAHASLNKKAIDLSLAKQIVKNFVKNISREISIDYIQKTVCEHFTIPVDLLKAKTRKREVVQARQLSMFLAKHHTKNSLKSIGQFFGGRDHSTVIHSCQAIQNLMDTDKKFKKSVEDIEKKIKMSTA